MEKFFSRMHERKQALKHEHVNRKGLWKEDERQVRQGTCEFTVKYLGHTEIYESKGVDICKQSFNRLKAEEHRSLQGRMRKSSTGSAHFSTLHVSSDGLRIVDNHEVVLVDVSIGDVSFCCPNTQYERGFMFICRSDIPWKWQCHALEAVEDNGNRLTNAVGFAFATHFEEQMAKRFESGQKTSAAAAGPSSSSSSSGERARVPPEQKQRTSMDQVMEVYPHKSPIEGKAGELLIEDEEADLGYKTDKF